MNVAITEVPMSSWSLVDGVGFECDHEYIGIKVVEADGRDQQGLHSSYQTVMVVCDDCGEEFPYED